MYQKLLAIVLIISLQSVTFAMFLVEFGFRINQKYIAGTLCENRDKPELKCHGKCYLMKMKKKVGDRNQEQDSRLSQVQFQQLFYNQVSSVLFYYSETEPFQPPVNDNSHFKGWPAPTDRPPGKA